MNFQQSITTAFSGMAAQQARLLMPVAHQTSPKCRPTAELRPQSVDMGSGPGGVGAGGDARGNVRSAASIWATELTDMIGAEMAYQAKSRGNGNRHGHVGRADERAPSQKTATSAWAGVRAGRPAPALLATSTHHRSRIRPSFRYPQKPRVSSSLAPSQGSIP